MQKLLDVLKALTLVTAIAVGASAVLVLLQISSAVKHANSALNGTVQQVNGAIASVQKTADLSGKLVNDARLSADNVNKAAIDERFYFERQLPGLMNQAHGILGNLQKATADLDPLLAETTARTKALAPIEANAAQMLTDADAMAKDPAIAASLSNLESSSAELAVASKAGAATATSIQAMAADGQEEVHNLTHPKKKLGFWGAVDGTLLWVHSHVLPPIL